LFDARGATELFHDAAQLIDFRLRSFTLIEDVLDLAESKAIGGIVSFFQCLSDVLLPDEEVDTEHSSLVRQGSGGSPRRQQKVVNVPNGSLNYMIGQHVRTVPATSARFITTANLTER
jgi:hypothetical protein